MRKRTGFGEIFASAALIFGTSGANSASTRTMPSSPTLAAMLPPLPCSM